MHQANSPEIIPGRCRAAVPRRLLTHFLIRGTNKSAETAAIAECKDMLEVISRGAEKFPAFHLRNPWIFGDSIQGRAYVLLDPESATLDPQHTLRASGAPIRGRKPV